ncbi:hypothetical protein MF6394_19425 [Pseudomonas sp. MF6394]|nr:hypothetical protein MF6394_19425 [Pseudomonas sp. MF6394]
MVVPLCCWICRESQNTCYPLPPVGASLLAKVVNDDAFYLKERGALEFFASKLAPTVVFQSFRTPNPGSSQRRAPSLCWPAGRCNRSSPAHPYSRPG